MLQLNEKLQKGENSAGRKNHAKEIKYEIKQKKDCEKRLRNGRRGTYTLLRRNMEICAFTGQQKALRRKNRTQRGKNAEAQGGSTGQQGAAKVRQVLQHVKVDIGVKGMIGIGEQIDQIFNERIYNKQLDRQHKKFLRKKAAPGWGWSCKNLFTMLLYNQKRKAVRRKHLN